MSIHVFTIAFISDGGGAAFGSTSLLGLAAGRAAFLGAFDASLPVASYHCWLHCCYRVECLYLSVIDDVMAVTIVVAR